MQRKTNIQYLRHCSVDIAYNTQIHVKDSCNCKHDKIDDSCLFEVLLKGFEEASDNIRFFVTCHFQCDIVGVQSVTAPIVTIGRQQIRKTTLSIIRSATRPMTVKNLLSMLNSLSIRLITPFVYNDVQHTLRIILLQRNLYKLCITV